MLKIGDTVAWRHAWGTGSVADAVVTGLDVTFYPREKYGDPADEVSWDLVQQNRVVVTLSNSHWAYGSQISPQGTDPNQWHK